MIYQVMLSENQSVLIHDVDIVQYDEDTVLFREEKGNFIAAFKMYNIVGFFRMDMPTQERKTYKWDFDLIDENTRKQNEEAEKKKGATMHIDLYRAFENAAKEQYRCRDISIGEVRDEMNEVMEEAFDRGISAPTGGTIPLLVRKELNNRMRNATCPHEIKQLSKMLDRNMEECLGVGL